MNEQEVKDRRIQALKLRRPGSKMKTVLMWAGIWPIVQTHRLLRCNWYIVVCMFSFNLIGIGGFIYKNRKNLNMVLTGIGIGLTFVSVSLKGVCYRRFRKNIVDIVDKLDNIMEEKVKTSTNEVWNITTDIMSYYSRKLFSGIFILGFAMLAVMWSRPTMTMAISHFRDHSTTFVRFYPTVYLWKIPPGSGVWFFHFSIDIISSWFLVSIGITTDNLYAYFVSKVVGNFRALNYELKNLQYDNIDNKQIRYYVARHQELSEICQLMAEVNGPFVLFFAISAAVNLCITVFQLSKMESLDVATVSWPLVYTSYKLLQIFIYSWGGELIKIESEAFRDAIYASGWTSGSREGSNMVRMMMYQPTIVLNACGVKPIAAQLFYDVVNTTMSYFFLLRTMNEK